METTRPFANVILDLPAREVRDKLFSYSIPPELQAETFAGTQVLVPFGSAGQISGYVVSLSRVAPQGVSPKPILEVLESEPLFDQEYVDFLRWVADYYCASLSDVVSAAVPSFLAPKIKRRIRFQPGIDVTKLLGAFEDQGVNALVKILIEAKGGSLSTLALRQRWRKATRGTFALFYRALGSLKELGLVESIPEKSALQAPKLVRSVVLTNQETSDTRHSQIIKALAEKGGQLSVPALVESAQTSASTISKMVEKGLLAYKVEESLRDPLEHLSHFHSPGMTDSIALTEDQTKVLSVLGSSLKEIQLEKPVKNGDAAELPEKAQNLPWLLHGVTGSGKTEIYLRLIDQTLKNGRSALMLVPEIALTPQLSRRLLERFGAQVAVWHSSLSAGERYDTWRRLRSGQARVLLGARSAILVDLPKLGLIILDEEHDSSYKQTTPSPRYNAKDVAVEKATRCGALVLFGSATPDVATYFRAQKENRIVALPKRIFNQALPKTEIVDMRDEFVHGNRSIFSTKLLGALAECLRRGEQAILLMNRRGFAAHVFCRACGYVVTCKNCSVSLVYHQHSVVNKKKFETSQPPSGGSPYRNSKAAEGYLACHHCGFTCANPSICPSCASPFIKQYGLGTQRVEQELGTYFPDAKVLRLDSDTATKKGAHEAILGSFAEGQADILIGTQMVAKGLDIERVTLVGVLAADASFNMPDYRSLERGFQLLTQVAGRAGRGQHAGAVILQTYNAEMPVLSWARAHHYQDFYEAEIEARQSFEYPPFSQLLRVVVAAEDANQATRECELIAEQLGGFLADLLPLSEIEILGPAPCLLERLRNKFREHLLIKNKAGEKGQALISQFFRQRKQPEGVVVAIDVDALDLL